jgi:hypothetical protein
VYYEVATQSESGQMAAKSGSSYLFVVRDGVWGSMAKDSCAHHSMR